MLLISMNIWIRNFSKYERICPLVRHTLEIRILTNEIRRILENRILVFIKSYLNVSMSKHMHNIVTLQVQQ